MQKTIKAHPGIYEFVDAIKLEDNHTKNTHLQLSTGVLPRRKPAYIMLDERIKNVVADFKVSDVLNYLHNLALIIDY